MGTKFNPFTGNLDFAGSAPVTPGGSDTHIQYNDGGAFGGDANLTWNKTTKLSTFTQASLTTTISPAIRVRTETAALTGARLQNSPAIQLRANAWSTSFNASRSIDFNNYVLPTTDSGEPIGEWRLDYSLNGATNVRGLQYATKYTFGGIVGLFRSNGIVEVTANNSSAIDVIQNLDIVNTSGTNSHLTMTFGGTIRYGVTTNSSGTVNYRSAGSTPKHDFFTGSTITSQTAAVSLSGSGVFTLFNGYHGAKVTAGSADTTVQTTLSSYGSLALKGVLVTSTLYTLAETETMVYCDPSSSNFCLGTPSVGSCISLGSEAACNAKSNIGCSWNPGTSCADGGGVDEYTCTDQGDGCAWDQVSCSGANNTGSSICEEQNNAFGGSCVWDELTCPTETEQGPCEGIDGCTWFFDDCADFNGVDQSSCEDNSGCSWTGAPCSDFTDQTTCEDGHTGCTWDSGTDTCVGVYDEDSSCVGMYNTSCTGSLCTGNYNDGNCSGNYGAFCSGTASCANLNDDGSAACNAESGCTWTVGITITLPTTANALRSTTGRVYSIVHVGSTGTCALQGQTGEDIFQYGTITLFKKGDKVLLHNQNIAFPCSLILTETPCNAQSGCSWLVPCSTLEDQETCESMSGCFWDVDENVCTGRETSECYGTYTNASRWYAHSLERGLNYQAKTANYTITDIDDIVDCTANSFTLTLPSAALNNGKQYTLKNTGSGTITLNTTSGQTIDGNASGVLTLTSGQSKVVASNNVNWVIIANV
jgi:hypothetical protein